MLYNFESPSCQQRVVMSYLLCFCQQTWSPAHSLVLKPREKHNRRADRKNISVNSQVARRHTKRWRAAGSPADWPWQRLFRCVISSCRPVSMARCSCFRKAIPLSTLATCCSSLPASMTESPRNLHTDAGSRMTREKGFSTAVCLHYSSVPILTLTQKSAWILNVNWVRKYMHF